MKYFYNSGDFASYKATFKILNPRRNLNYFVMMHDDRNYFSQIHKTTILIYTLFITVHAFIL